MVFFLFFSLASSRLHAATADDYYRAGLSFYQQGRYAQSIPYFRAAVRLEPLHWKACQAQGQAHYLTGDLPSAFALFERSLEINPSNRALRDWVGKLKERQGTLSGPRSIVGGVKKGAKADPFGRNQVFFSVGAAWYKPFLDDLAGAEVPGMGARTREEGLTAMGEVGYSWDGMEGAGMGFEATWPGRMTWEGSSYSLTLSPQLFSTSLLYHNHWADGLGRWWARIGAGYHHATVLYSQVSSLGASFSGSLSGDIVGASAAVGREIQLFEGIGLNLSAGFRYAYFEMLTGHYSGGQLTLGLDAGNFIQLVDLSGIESGAYVPAPFDFSGLDLGLGLEFNFD